MSRGSGGLLQIGAFLSPTEITGPRGDPLSPYSPSPDTVKGKEKETLTLAFEAEIEAWLNSGMAIQNDIVVAM